MKYIWVQLGAGRGKRLGGLPKPFRRIGSKYLLTYAAETFLATFPDGHVVGVVSAEDFLRGQRVLARALPSRQFSLVVGGAERQDSTTQAILHLLKLNLIEPTSLVAFHDAARPLVPAAVITRAFAAAAENGTAVCAMPVSFSIRQQTPHGSKHLDRTQYWEVQTPQVIRGDVLLAAWDKFPPSSRPDFTDEGSWLEAAGIPVHLVAGHPYSLKVTYETDLWLVRHLAQQASRGR